MSVQTVKATINGQSYDLTYDSTTQTYTATISAPTKSSYTINVGHYYPVSVTATDDAGNTTTVNDTHASFGDDLKLKVKEKVAPVIKILKPTADSTITSATPTIQWQITDDDSGVDPASIKLTIDDGTPITGTSIKKTTMTGGYTCIYEVATALSNGTHTFVVEASDYDGNATTSTTTTFTVDTVPPALTITSPEDGLKTNVNKVTVAGTTNDATSTSVTITVNGVSVPVDDDGSFSYELELENGENTITIIATDGAGLTTTVTRTVTLDTGAPVFQSITITPNPVDAGATYVIRVKVTD